MERLQMEHILDWRCNGKNYETTCPNCLRFVDLLYSKYNKYKFWKIVQWNLPLLVAFNKIIIHRKRKLLRLLRLPVYGTVGS